MYFIFEHDTCKRLSEILSSINIILSIINVWIDNSHIYIVNIKKIHITITKKFPYKKINFFPNSKKLIICCLYHDPMKYAICIDNEDYMNMYVIQIHLRL